MSHDRDEVLQRLFRTEEVADPPDAVAELFLRSHRHAIPGYPRHFVMWYLPPNGRAKPAAYVHHLPFGGVHLGGGMCADAAIYREMPGDAFRKARDAGGFATMILRDTFTMLGDSAAVFGHVAEPRARQADLRAGMRETGREHLLVYWITDLPEDEKQRIVERVARHGPF